MEILPTTKGTRPRVAVEVRPEGVVAAASENGAGVISAISRGDLRPGSLAPGCKAGNLTDRGAVVAAVRRALDGIGGKGKDRVKYVTVVVPDAASRVLLLDFDTLPGKPAEALAVVRFRLKKLLPFDAEHAVVSYQVMGSDRASVQVLAVAMPPDVLAEYEGVVTEAGYLPGAVLPSTLAVLAGIEDAAGVALVVNAGGGSVTTAIVQGASLLLHRTLDLGPWDSGTSGTAPGETLAAEARSGVAAGEGLMAAAMRMAAATRAESSEDPRHSPAEQAREDLDRMDAESSMQTAVLGAGRREEMPKDAVAALNSLPSVDAGREVAQAVSVAAAYFEDTLGRSPELLLSAGTLGAERLAWVLRQNGMEGIKVQEALDSQVFAAGASSATVPRGWLAGVRGALRS